MNDKVEVKVTCDRADENGQPVWSFVHEGWVFEHHGPMIVVNGVPDESVNFQPVRLVDQEKP